MQYVEVARGEGETAIKFSCQEDGTLLLSKIQRHFPEVIGLSYCKTGLSPAHIFPPINWELVLHQSMIGNFMGGAKNQQICFYSLSDQLWSGFASISDRLHFPSVISREVMLTDDHICNAAAVSNIWQLIWISKHARNSLTQNKTVRCEISFRKKTCSGHMSEVLKILFSSKCVRCPEALSDDVNTGQRHWLFMSNLCTR